MLSDDALEKLPLGALHVEVVALPPLVPANVTVPPEQTVCAGPAFAVAAALTVITTVLVAATQGPATVRVIGGKG